METKEDILILAIESSCDETAASVVKNGREVLSNIISSQIELHTLYGGVVPEIASRKHIEKINQVIEEALVGAGVTLEEITELLRSMGEPAFRGRQVFSWLHKGVTSLEEMTNLSKSLREKLRERCHITVPKVARRQVSAEDGDRKSVV